MALFSMFGMKRSLPFEAGGSSTGRVSMPGLVALDDGKTMIDGVYGLNLSVNPVRSRFIAPFMELSDAETRTLMVAELMQNVMDSVVSRAGDWSFVLHRVRTHFTVSAGGDLLARVEHVEGVGLCVMQYGVDMLDANSFVTGDSDKKTDGTNAGGYGMGLKQLVVMGLFKSWPIEMIGTIGEDAGLGGRRANRITSSRDGPTELALLSGSAVGVDECAQHVLRMAGGAASWMYHCMHGVGIESLWDAWCSHVRLVHGGEEPVLETAVAWLFCKDRGSRMYVNGTFSGFSTKDPDMPDISVKAPFGELTSHTRGVVKVEKLVRLLVPSMLCLRGDAAAAMCDAPNGVGKFIRRMTMHTVDAVYIKESVLESDAVRDALTRRIGQGYFDTSVRNIYDAMDGLGWVTEEARRSIKFADSDGLEDGSFLKWMSTYSIGYHSFSETNPVEYDPPRGRDTNDLVRLVLEKAVATSSQETPMLRRFNQFLAAFSALNGSPANVVRLWIRPWSTNLPYSSDFKTLVADLGDGVTTRVYDRDTLEWDNLEILFRKIYIDADGGDGEPSVLSREADMVFSTFRLNLETPGAPTWTRAHSEKIKRLANIGALDDPPIPITIELVE